MIYSEIFNFCKIRNAGSCYSNGTITTPRVNFIIDLIQKLNIPYEIHNWKINDFNIGFNIVLRGTSNRIVTAHHDIMNPNIDNANDNSASIINAISLKLLCPEITVVLLDGEEVGGLGSDYLSSQINDRIFGEVEWILNLELTGKGGSTFFIGDYPGKLSDHIRGIFDCPIVRTPFNDSVIFRKHGIDSVVINPLPLLAEGSSNVKWGEDYLDFSIIYNCHTHRDSIDTVCINDMQVFVEQVLFTILTN